MRLPMETYDRIYAETEREFEERHKSAYDNNCLWTSIYDRKLKEAWEAASHG